MRIVVTLLLLAGTAHAAPVSFEMGGGRLTITVAGAPVATYVWDDVAIPRPYFCGLRAPNGAAVTRTHPPDPKGDAGNDDHATFHPGLWLAFGDLGGIDFWRNKARVRQEGFVESPVGGEDEGHFAVRYVYETMDTPPRVVCEAEVRYDFRVTGHGYMFSCDAVFTPVGGAFAFGDQEEMGFGIRLATPLTVKHGHGRLINCDGGRDETGTWGQPALWCAGMGELDGVTVGAVVMPAPGNFRPSWFHSRDYGLIVANPFGKKSMTAPDDASVSADSTMVGAEDTLRLGFAAGFFSTQGDVEATVKELYATYLD